MLLLAFPIATAVAVSATIPVSITLITVVIIITVALTLPAVAVVFALVVVRGALVNTRRGVVVRGCGSGSNRNVAFFALQNLARCQFIRLHAGPTDDLAPTLTSRAQPEEVLRLFARFGSQQVRLGDLAEALQCQFITSS